MVSETSVLIVGATRGLGASLAKQYAQQGASVCGTARSSSVADTLHPRITWIHSIDVSKEGAGQSILKANPNTKYDLVIITAGYFVKESFEEPNFQAELTMYTTCAIGPTFLVQCLVTSNALAAGSKILLVSSEAGSITLRHESEGGGMYGHHASKAALNMCGRLLSYDLKDRQIAVGMVHPGFMRTDLTRSVGFDKFWNSGGAITPDEAATTMREWIETFDMSKTGEFWASRGPNDIGTISEALGKEKSELPTPLKLPW